MAAERDMFLELEDAAAISEGDLETIQFVKGHPAKAWITTVDYALAAGISEDAVRRYIIAGYLPAKSVGCNSTGRTKYLISRARAIQFFKSNNH